VFFHGKQIAIRAAFVQIDTLTRLSLSGVNQNQQRSQTVFVYWKDRPARSDGEIRGEFWDLGRLNEDDPRFSGYDLRPALDAANAGRWPGRDQVFVVVGATLVDAPIPASPTVRAIALAPDRFADRTATVVGRFRGRNLYGDLPAPLNRSRWDFVLQSADAAIWVSGMRPRGRDFELDAGAKADTGRWLEVTGMVKTEGTRVWIEAESLELTAAAAEVPVEIVVPQIKEPPPQVVFSSPIPDETDVERTSTVRLQFSRDMDGRTFNGRVRVSYAAPAGANPAPEAPIFSATYREANRALEIRFAKPLERFQAVKVELLEGITATDGQPLPHWTLAFTTGR
jgi:hypothetical protein